MKFWIIVISTILGGALTCLLLLAASHGVFTAWHPLQPPPEMASRILGADSDSLFIETISGQVYKCQQFTRDAKCWGETSWPQEIKIDPYLSECAQYKFLVPQPPHKVIDQTEVRNCGVDIILVVNYAILEDGNIWEWRHSSSGIAVYIYTELGTIGGFVIGVFIAIGLHLMQGKRLRKA